MILTRSSQVKTEAAAPSVVPDGRRRRRAGRTGRAVDPVAAESFAGNCGQFPVISRAMANKEQRKEKKNKKPPLKTKAEKRAEKIARKNSRS
jgi:hypothetical protein